MRWLAVPLLFLCACTAESYGTRECGPWDDASCPGECKKVTEKRLDSGAKCWRDEMITCTKTQAGTTAMNGCCVREDGAIFRTASGGPECPYRAPAYLGFRDCSEAERKDLPDDDC